ncbi:MAG: 30S ribosomal protein S2 [Bacteroides sp.]
MPNLSFEQMLDAKVHFGHQTQKWCPKMAPYIFMERNGYHVIDLRKTLVKVDEAAQALRQIARSGRRILFVATKKQAKEVVATRVKEVGMPFVTERWPGGMLTNFPTIRKAVKKMSNIDKMITDGTYENMSKREKLQLTRVRAKLEKNLGSIADMNKLPSALFVVDVQREYIAVREANRLGIPVFAMVDTCCDPTPIDFVIPANDDVNTSIDLIIGEMCEAIKEGLLERKMDRNNAEQDTEEENEEVETKKVAASDEDDE